MKDVVQYQTAHKIEDYLQHLGNIFPAVDLFFTRASAFGGNTAGASMTVLLGVLKKSAFHFVKRCQSTVTMPSALLVLAEGAEEMETVITADVLRRGGVSRSRLCIHKLSPCVVAEDLR